MIFQVSVVLPDTLKVPESLSLSETNDCDYYKITNVKLSEFVAKDFISSFVNSGKCDPNLTSPTYTFLLHRQFVCIKRRYENRL